MTEVCSLLGLIDYSKKIESYYSASASASELQHWLKFCMQSFFSQTTDAIDLKLKTLIGHH